MPAAELREAVKALMPRAKDDLAELVAFQSVADPKQFPPEECEKAAQWVVDAFAAAGLQDVRMSRPPTAATPCTATLPGPRARRPCCCTATTTSSRRSARTRGRCPVFELTERDGRWYGRGAADCKGNIVMHLTALRALEQANGGFPCGIKLICEGSEEQGTGGLEAFVPENVELLRADTILVGDTGNFAVGVPTLTTTLRGMTSVDVTLEALAARCTPACSAARRRTRWSAMIQLLGSLHDEHGNTTIDGLDNTPDAGRRRVPGRAVPRGRQRARRRRADGRRLGRGHAVGAPVGDGARHRRAARDRLLRRDPGVGRGARQPADPARGRRPGGTGRAGRAPARAACPGACSCTIERVAVGDPFVGSLTGPATSR